MAEQDAAFEQEMVEIFLEEANEILVQLEEDLLELERDPSNTEIIDSVFRSMHTIKGSAGLTGLNSISHFAHVIEDMLDQIRKGEVKLSDSCMMILLDSVDLLKKMVRALTEGGLENLIERASEIEELLNFIMDLTGPGTEEPAETGADKRHYRIKMHFNPDLFTTGTDPLMLIEELQEKGEIKSVTLNINRLPDLFELDPHLLYLSWTLVLETEESRESLAQIFIFVEENVSIEEIDYEAESEQLTSKTMQELVVDEGIAEPVEVEKAVRQQKSWEDILAREGKVSPKQVQQVAQKQSLAKENQEVRTIRVDTQKLEQIMNDVAELAIAQSRIKDLIIKGASSCSNLDETKYVFEEINKITRRLQEKVMQASMVPIGSTFVRFQRMVRDLSRQKGKEIDLVITGKETELDRKVIEQITDPLKHMIRNSVDHGLETPEERESAGKPRRGKIFLRAYYREGGIIIEVADDGRGMDPEAILAKAIDKGLVSEEQKLSREEIFNLPFLPGFSTASEISDISGRGVGLDVVRTNIESLRGSVEVSSEVGIGTRFSIRLPLTLAIIDGMMVSVGGERFLIPVTSIIEFLKLSGRDVRNVTGKAPVVLIRGEYIPLVNLAGILNIRGRAGSVEEGMVVVVQDQRRRKALLVDDIEGQEQVVIKSIKENYDQVEGIAGATILGDGKVAMILDVSALMRMPLNRPA